MKHLVLLLTLLVAITSHAADDPANQAAKIAEIRRLAQNIKPQDGVVVIGDGLAKVTLPSTLRYLKPEDTETVLVKLWGNPKVGRTLGMIVPSDFEPLGGESWAVVMTFEEDGYVKDDDAAHMDYSKLLKEMQDGTREANQERVKQGYEAIELIGWAAPPRYDAATKKLYWAKEIKFGDSPEHTLNYNFRLLGRRGVLVLNAVASMSQLKLVEAVTPDILAAVNFQEGHRYADFKESTDKVATYGLAALVAGGIAAKAGFFKVLIAGILALKKFVIIGVIALFTGIKKFWAWLNAKKAAKVSTATELPPAA
jgi:uncharacterized membrane-anchored protein